MGRVYIALRAARTRQLHDGVYAIVRDKRRPFALVPGRACAAQFGGDDRQYPPSIFVVGCQRSDTTLLRLILDPTPTSTNAGDLFQVDSDGRLTGERHWQHLAYFGFPTTCRHHGPLPEGYEHVGGITIIAAPDLDVALAWPGLARPSGRSPSRSRYGLSTTPGLSLPGQQLHLGRPAD
jgi:hypothetical protein